MPDLSTVLAFCAATVALLLIPGPAVIYILNRSIGDGRKVGLAAVGGLEVGDAIQVLFASLGLSAVLAASATLFNIVKWAGVALNPKTALFFLSIFPQFIDTNSDHAQLQSLFLGAIFVVLATLFNGSYSLMASGLRHLLLRGRTLPFIQRYVSGSLFVGLGLLAATAGRTK